MEKLDLHGLNYDEARRETIKFIEKHWDNFINLEIVTGHSIQMQNVVSGVLDEYKLTYSIGGFLGIDQSYILVFM